MSGSLSSQPSPSSASASSAKRSFALTHEELERFERDGATDAYDHPLLEGTDLVDTILDKFALIAPTLAWPGPTHEHMASKLDGGAPWFHSGHALVPELYALAAHPAIVDRVVSILGADVLLWGTAVLTKNPGDVHGWHVDTTDWDGVGVFVGLRGLSRDTTLKVATGTHRVPVSPSQAMLGGKWDGIRGAPELADDRVIETIARRYVPNTRILKHEIETGQFYVFHGRVWHGSNNVGAVPRTAATFFFARTDAKIRIPTTFGGTPTWYENRRPPCILMSGADHFGRNLLVAPPR